MIGDNNIYVVTWNCGSSAPITQANLLLELQSDTYFLIDILEPDMNSFDFFDREAQTREEIQSYFDYLKESGEGDIRLVGNACNRIGVSTILPLVKQSVSEVNDVRSLLGYLANLRTKISALYHVYNQIRKLPLHDGDMITTLSRNNTPLYKEKIIRRGSGEYMLLPTDWTSIDLDGEAMAQAELYEYIFHLLTQEGHSIHYHSKLDSGENPLTISYELHKQTVR